MIIVLGGFKSRSSKQQGLDGKMASLRWCFWQPWQNYNHIPDNVNAQNAKLQTRENVPLTILLFTATWQRHRGHFCYRTQRQLRQRLASPDVSRWYSWSSMSQQKSLRMEIFWLNCRDQRMEDPPCSWPQWWPGCLPCSLRGTWWWAPFCWARFWLSLKYVKFTCGKIRPALLYR